MKSVIISILLLAGASMLAQAVHATPMWCVGIGWMAMAIRFEIDRNRTWVSKEPAQQHKPESP